MSDGLLTSIIQLEKQIQAEVAGEQERADEWQQRELATLEQSFAAANAGEKDNYQQQLAEKRLAIENEGAALEATSADWCERLRNLEEATLRELLRRHLAEILPGGEYDHPHGQS